MTTKDELFQTLNKQFGKSMDELNQQWAESEKELKEIGIEPTEDMLVQKVKIWYKKVISSGSKPYEAVILGMNYTDFNAIARKVAENQGSPGIYPKGWQGDGEKIPDTPSWSMNMPAFIKEKDDANYRPGVLAASGDIVPQISMNFKKYLNRYVKFSGKEAKNKLNGEEQVYVDKTGFQPSDEITSDDLKTLIVSTAKEHLVTVDKFGDWINSLDGKKSFEKRMAWRIFSGNIIRVNLTRDTARSNTLEFDDKTVSFDPSGKNFSITGWVDKRLPMDCSDGTLGTLIITCNPRTDEEGSMQVDVLGMYVPVKSRRVEAKPVAEAEIEI